MNGFVVVGDTGNVTGIQLGLLYYVRLFSSGQTSEIRMGSRGPNCDGLTIVMDFS